MFQKINPQTVFNTTPEFLPLIDPANKHYHCRHKVWYGGRGGLKSWQIARGLLFLSLQSTVTILCTREFQNSIADSVLKVLANQIKLLNLDSYFSVQKTSIITYTGSEFIFKGLRHNVSAIQSLEGVDITWIEEAQTINQDSINILYPTVLRKDNSVMLVSFNPKLKTDPIYKKYITTPPPNSYICEINYDSNPWFPTGLREEMEYDRQHDMQRYLHIWKGKTVKHTESLVIKKWRVDGNIAPGDDTPLYYGADWGFSVDPTVLMRCWVEQTTKEIFIDYAIRRVGVELDDLPDFFDQVPGARKWMITADNARPETISKMKSAGFKMRASKKGAGSVEAGITFLQGYTLVIHPRAQAAIDEVALYSYKTNKMTGEVLPILEDRHNHCLVGGTLVDTGTGPVPIEQLVGKTGFVRSFDGGKRVLKKFFNCRKTRKNATILEVELADGRIIKATPDHRVLTHLGWVRVRDLVPGYFIRDVGAR